jgi:hypothetical protein
VQAGDTVDIVATQGTWAQVKVLGEVDAPLGWLPSSALTTSLSATAINKVAFAAECRRQSTRFEAYGVYLAAIATLRSNITNDREGTLIGPFRLTEREWDFFCGDPELGEDANGDITNWRTQCAVFALMSERSVDALADELKIDSGAVTPTKLYLAQMIGAPAAAQLINNPALPIDPSNINNVPGLSADPDLGPQLLQRYGQFLLTKGQPALGRDILAKISAALGPPITAVRPLVVPPIAPGAAPPPPDPKPIKGDDLFTAKAPKIMRDLMKDFEISKLHAAGILGNIGHECGGFKLMQEQKPRGGRGGFGWCQWTGPRRVSFESFCEQRNLDMKSDAANYGFLQSELSGPYKNAISKLTAAPDLNSAVIAFESAFERAAADVKYFDRRERYARMALACVP